MSIIKKSGGIKAFSDIADKHVKSEKGVFFLLWALIPVTFIDCGFRIVGAGSITSSLAEKNKIAKERFAFMLNNTASPVVELIPIATTFVGFNIANISIGLKAAGNPESASAYSIWLKAIPLEFFSIVLIIVTFLTIFFQFKKPAHALAKPSAEKEMKGMKMDMNGKMDKCDMMNKTSKTDTKKAASYACPMHPEVTADKPGKCSKCGMDLEKKK
jgi:Na+/H+ antiporter NhaC